MKLVGSLIVLSLAVGCALPANEEAHKQSAAQNAMNPNDLNGGGQELSPPDDDPNNEEGANTCDASGTIPDGWTRIDVLNASFAVPPGATGSVMASEWFVGDTMFFVTPGSKNMSLDDGEAHDKAFFAAGKDGPRPCQATYMRETAACLETLHISAICSYETPRLLDWHRTNIGPFSYFYGCDSADLSAGDLCAKFAATFHAK